MYDVNEYSGIIEREGDRKAVPSGSPVCTPQGEGSTMNRILCTGTVILILIAAFLFAVLSARPAAPGQDLFLQEEVNRGTSLLEVSTLDADWHLGR